MLEESTGNFSATRNMYDWYQTSTHVIINVMIKNLRESDVRVRLIDETLDVSCSLADGSLFKLHFSLFKPIYVAESNWSVTPSKLEIKLKKTDRKRWQSLEVIPEKGVKRSTAVAGIVQPESATANKKQTPSLATNNHANHNNGNNGSSVNDDSLTMSGAESGRGKPRYDWYQTDAYVVVTVMIRNLTPEHVNVEFSDTTADLSCRLDENTLYTLHLQLFREINCKESTFKVTTSKVELKMKKAESNRWQQLEEEGSGGDEPVATLKLSQTNAPEEPTSAVDTNGNTDNDSQANVEPSESNESVENHVADNGIEENQTKSAEQQPQKAFEASEPSIESTVDSSGPSAPAAVLNKPKTKKGPKNWDKIAKEIEEEEKAESINGGGSVEELFRSIYGSGSDETRRAMMKSFIESGGTVLSTNWNEVGQKKVEVKPPDGCEYRQWNK